MQPSDLRGRELWGSIGPMAGDPAKVSRNFVFQGNEPINWVMGGYICSGSVGSLNECCGLLGGCSGLLTGWRRPQAGRSSESDYDFTTRGRYHVLGRFHLVMVGSRGTLLQTGRLEITSRSPCGWIIWAKPGTDGSRETGFSVADTDANKLQSVGSGLNASATFTQPLSVLLVLFNLLPGRQRMDDNFGSSTGGLKSTLL